MVFINELKEAGVLKDEDTARLDEISKNILVEFKYEGKQASFQLGYNREDGVELIKLRDGSRPHEDFPLVQKLKELFDEAR
jgi:hydrogenase maturation factor HypE